MYEETKLLFIAKNLVTKSDNADD